MNILNATNFNLELDNCKSVSELRSIFQEYINENNIEGILEITRFLTYKHRIEQIISKNERGEDVTRRVVKNAIRNTIKNNVNNENDRIELIENIYNFKSFLSDFCNSLKKFLKDNRSKPIANFIDQSNLDELLIRIEGKDFNFATLENGDIDLKVAGDPDKQRDEKTKDQILQNHYTNILVVGNVLKITKKDLEKTKKDLEKTRKNLEKKKRNLTKTQNLNDSPKSPEENSKSNTIQYISTPNIPALKTSREADQKKIDNIQNHTPIEQNSIPTIKQTPVPTIEQNHTVIEQTSTPIKIEDNISNNPDIQNTSNIYEQDKKKNINIKFSEDKEEDEKICYKVYSLLFDCLSDEEKEKEENFIKKEGDNDIWYNDIFERMFEYDVIKNNKIFQNLKFKEMVDEYMKQPSTKKRDKRGGILLIINKIQLALREEENNKILERTAAGSKNLLTRDELIENFTKENDNEEEYDDDEEEDDEEKKQFKKIQNLCLYLKIEIEIEQEGVVSNYYNIVININNEVNKLAKIVETKLNKEKEQINKKVDDQYFFIEENIQSKNKDVLDNKLTPNKKIQENISENISSNHVYNDRMVERNIINNNSNNDKKIQENISSNQVYNDKKIEKNIVNNYSNNDKRGQQNISNNPSNNDRREQENINNNHVYNDKRMDNFNSPKPSEQRNNFNSTTPREQTNNSNGEAEFKILSDKNKSLNISDIVQELKDFDFSIIKGYGKLGGEKDYLQINPLNIWRFLLGEIKDNRSLRNAFKTIGELKGDCKKSDNLKTFENFFQYTMEIMETIQGYIKNNKGEELTDYLIKNKLYSEKKSSLIEEVFNNPELNAEEKLAQLISKSKLYKEVSKIADKEVVFSKVEEVKKVNDKKQEIIYEKKITDLVQFNVKIPNLKYIDKINSQEYEEERLVEELEETFKKEVDKKTDEVELFINEEGTPEIVKDDFDYTKIAGTKGYIMYFKNLKAAKYFLKSHINEENKKNKEQNMISENQNINNINNNNNFNEVIDSFSTRREENQLIK